MLSWTSSWTRILFAFPVSILASCLATASVDSGPRGCHGTGPSNFDYLVLASIADSPQGLAMVNYRPASPHGAPGS
ncbi:MAG: hypothetical protein WBF89_18045 [Steroidobacteraceae bacterium]